MAMRLSSKKPVASINVAPLVDVVLVLLIIFMVLTPLADKHKYIRVPEEPDAQLVQPEQVPPDQTVLTVLANGRVLLNKQELDISQAMAQLAAAYQGRPSKPLFFNAQDNVPYAQAYQVLDAAHEAGVNTIGMITDAPIF